MLLNSALAADARRVDSSSGIYIRNGAHERGPGAACAARCCAAALNRILRSSACIDVRTVCGVRPGRQASEAPTKGH